MYQISSIAPATNIASSLGGLSIVGLAPDELPSIGTSPGGLFIVALLSEVTVGVLGRYQLSFDLGITRSIIWTGGVCDVYPSRGGYWDRVQLNSSLLNSIATNNLVDVRLFRMMNRWISTRWATTVFLTPAAARIAWSGRSLLIWFCIFLITILYRRVPYRGEHCTYYNIVRYHLSCQLLRCSWSQSILDGKELTQYNDWDPICHSLHRTHENSIVIVCGDVSNKTNDSVHWGARSHKPL